MLSDCCGAEVIWTDICSECKEHCEPWDEDDPDIQMDMFDSEYDIEAEKLKEKQIGEY